jgi:hypothetical protein
VLRRVVAEDAFELFFAEAFEFLMFVLGERVPDGLGVADVAVEVAAFE